MNPMLVIGAYVLASVLSVAMLRNSALPLHDRLFLIANIAMPACLGLDIFVASKLLAAALDDAPPWLETPVRLAVYLGCGPLIGRALWSLVPPARPADGRWTTRWHVPARGALACVIRRPPRRAAL